MFYESDDTYEASYLQNNTQDDVDEDEDDIEDIEDIESALYAQIHFHQESEEDHPVLSGFSTSLQTLSGGSDPTTQNSNGSRQGSARKTSTSLIQPSSSSAPSPSLLLSPPTVDTIDLVSISSEPIDVAADDCVSVSSDHSSASSDCMLLDETLSDTGDILVHVQPTQQAILKDDTQQQSPVPPGMYLYIYTDIYICYMSTASKVSPSIEVTSDNFCWTAM